MDSRKIGKLIASKRKEKGMTQKELGLKINVSDKTISKWESGLGLPDISSIQSLASVLDLNVNEILTGDVNINDNNMANMKKTKFYFCGKCGNIIASTNNLILNCCGQKLTEIKAEELKYNMDSKKFVDNNENLTRKDIKVEYIEDDIFVSIDHPMTKSHFITFIAYVIGDKLMINKLYPEQNAYTRFKRCGHGTIYVLCNKHGLVSIKI